jgi:DNA polymerase-1
VDELFLIDASGFIYRSYFAIQGMSSRQGESTAALFGFIRSYFKLTSQFNPKHLVAK